MLAKRARICSKVRFSLPSMYRSPGRPRSAASRWPWATSRTSTRFKPVSTKAGIFTAQKIEDDLAGWGWLPVMIANRRGWIHNDHGEPGSRLLESNLFGQPLRTLVMADHIGKRDRRGFVAKGVLGHADAADGAGVHDAFDAGSSSGFEHVARAIHIGVIQLLRAFRPEAIIGCDMEEKLATLKGAGERNRIAQVTGHRFYVEVTDPACWTAKGAHTITLG